LALSPGRDLRDDGADAQPVGDAPGGGHVVAGEHDHLDTEASTLIGTLSFLAPFVAAMLACRYLAGWDWRAAEIGGIALSTTSLAVVYAVLWSPA
jgi:hypothetical protein